MAIKCLMYDFLTALIRIPTLEGGTLVKPAIEMHTAPHTDSEEETERNLRYLWSCDMDDMMKPVFPII